MKTLLVALGSNLGDREAQIRRAVAMMEERFSTKMLLSPCIETAPSGFDSKNSFLNAAARCETDLLAARILDITETIERELGRKEKSSEGAYHDRLIDIDLLALGDEVLETDCLTLPHPRMADRRFVLEPLCQVASDIVHPILGKTYKELLDALNRLKISEVSADTEDVVDAINRLLLQLSADSIPYTVSMLADLLKNPATHLFVGHDEENRVCATYTLCIAPSITGCKAWIEDVVVDESCRGRGYGRQLIAHAVEAARALKAKSLNLTSRPDRQAANALYRRCGFHRRETNVYRMKLI